MRLDPNPLFRKMIAPWYDSNLTCWIVLIVMLVIMLFSWAGIAAALGNPSYRAFYPLPVLLFLLSFTVAVSVGVRLVRRRYDRHVQDKEL